MNKTRVFILLTVVLVSLGLVTAALAAAQPGLGISNTVTITASNDMESNDNYTVTLVVTDALGYSDEAASLVTVSSGCIPLTSVDFTFSPQKPSIGAQVNLTAIVIPANADMLITYM